MDFNSLDAQYEACVAYIARQANGELISQRYDVGASPEPTLSALRFSA
jgi:hypothetical protein